MKIGVDLDNTLNTMCETLLSIYNEDADDDLMLSDITDYKIDTFVKPDWQDKITTYFSDDLLWNKVGTVPMCQKYVKQLLDDGHEVYVVTSSHLYDMPVKYKWIKRKFPFIDRRNIITIQDKKLLKLDVLVDDYAENLYGGNFKKILLAYPWNENAENSMREGIVRCKDWAEIYAVISRIRCSKTKFDFECLDCPYVNE